MSADLLRKAAALMRKRAEAATPGPWKIDSNDCCVMSKHDPFFVLGERTGARLQDLRHSASWHPAVALAVADWLDREATLHESITGMGDLLNLAAKELGAGQIRLQFSDAGDQMAASTMPQALAVATAYLGDQS